MGKISPNNITSLNQDWGMDTAVNLPFSGAAVQAFIKSYLRNVSGAAWFNEATSTMYFFATAEDRDAFIADQSRTYLITFSCVMNFGSTQMYRVNITNNTGSTVVNVAINDGTCPLSTSFVVQTKGLTDPSWEDTQLGAYVTIYVDRGVTGQFVPITERTLYPTGSTIALDVFNYLDNGANRVRFTFEAEDGSVTNSLMYTVNVSELYLEIMNSTWYVPVVSSNPDSLVIGGFRIGGTGSKTLHIDILNKQGQKVIPTIDQLIGTTNAYSTTPYYYRILSGSPILSLPTGVYTVSATVSTEMLTSQAVQYDIMVVANADVNTAQLICFNNVADKIYNYSTSEVCQYSIYNKGLLAGDVTAKFSRISGGLVVDYTTATYSDVPTGHAQPLNYSVDWNVEGEGYFIEVELELDNVTSQVLIPLDNTALFPPTAGYDFYLNAAIRSNSDSNKDKIVNTVDNSELAATWNMVDFINGIDGWTVDDNGRRCLRIPAGCSVSLPAEAFRFLGRDNSTLEFCYKVVNVSDYDENVMTIALNPTQAGFQGLRIKPTNITVHSILDTTAVNDSKRGVSLLDEETVHMMLVFNPYFEGNHKLVTGYINGCKNFEFAYTSSSDWSIEAPLVIAPAKSDVYLYFIRHYDSALGDSMIQANFISSLLTYNEREAVKENIMSVVDSGQVDISYENVKNNNFNFFVVHMDDDGEIPSAAGGWGKKTKKTSRLEMHYGNHPEWDWMIENVETMGQGTTSMNYYRWNIRWRIDKSADKQVPVRYLIERTKVRNSYTYNWGVPTSQKTVLFDGDNHPAVMRITAKINQASSMQSHKIGATMAYTMLHDALGLRNEAQAAADLAETPRPTVAVYQYPAFGFMYNEQANVYIFAGLFTIGPDKGDKPTFGYDKTKNSLISLEGTDHSQPLARFAYPWNNDVHYLASEEGLTIVKGTEDYETGLEVSNCHGLGTDSAADQQAIEDVLIAEYKPAYDLSWNNSTLVFGIPLGTYGATASATLDYINNHLATFRATMYNSRLSYADMQFWIEGEYKLYYYDVKLERYVADQTFVPNGNTVEEQNENLKAARRAAFKASAENYFDIQDTIFDFLFLLLFGATDNFAKNSYPYKMATLAGGGRWKWRQDDLDTIADIDNVGGDTKPYFIEFLDAAGGSPYFAGSNSTFWNLIFECYWEDYVSTVTGLSTSGIQSMGRSILELMRSLSGASNVYDGFLAFLRMTFWSNAQDYFPTSAYNVDSNFKYEQAWINNGQEADPLAQSLGNHYAAEKLWMKRRAVYMMSLFKAGSFGDYSDQTLGRMAFRPAGSGLDTMISPAVWLYPALCVGQNTVVQGNRTQAGNSTRIQANGDGNTEFYIQATDYLASLGDLKNLVLGSGYLNPLAVTGKKLTTFKIGDAVAGNVTTNVPGLNFTNTKCLEVIDARNAQSVTTINIEGCSRLRQLLLSGTGVTGADIPEGSKITDVSLPAGIQRLTLINLRHLTVSHLTLDDPSQIVSLRVENSAIDSIGLLKIVLDASADLHNFRAVWGYTIEDDGTYLPTLSALAQSNCKGLNEQGMEVPNPVVTGTVHSTGGLKQSAINAIESRLTGLNLSVDKIYIDFADSNVEAICLSKGWGDGVGITTDAAAAVTSLSGFSGNTTITSFDELQYFTGLTTIPDSAFKNDTALQSVILPSSVVTVGWTAFAGCTNLESVNFNYIRTFDGFAFKGIAVSGEIVIPNATSFSCGVFNGCTNITKVDFTGSTLTSIGALDNAGYEGPFQGCSTLEEVILPSTLTILGPKAFYNCSSLITINTQNVTELYTQAFNNTAITHFDNFEHVTRLQGSAFYRSELSGEVNLSILAGTIPSAAFGHTKITSLNIPYINTIGAYSGDVPAEYGPFYDCALLTQVTAPRLSEIGKEAFHNCINLTTVSGNNITKVGAYAFAGCTKLANINLTAATHIDSYAFINTNLSGTLNLLALTNLGRECAFQNTKITSLNLPVLISISDPGYSGWGVFAGCTLLETVSMASLTTIPSGMFKGCTLLTSVTCPNVIGIHNEAFLNCSSLSSFTFNPLTTSIGESAFNNSGITGELSLPNLLSIANDAFKKTKITKVSNLGYITTLGISAFEGCTSLTEVVLPASLTNLLYGVFRLCSSLTKVTCLGGFLNDNDCIPNSIKEIWLDPAKLSEWFIYDINGTGWNANIMSTYQHLRKLKLLNVEDTNYIIDGVILYGGYSFTYPIRYAGYGITKMLTLTPGRYKIYTGFSSITGAPDSGKYGYIYTYDINNNQLSRIDFTAGENIIDITNSNVTSIRISVKLSELANCYVQNAVTEEYVWKGSEVTAHYTGYSPQ